MVEHLADAFKPTSPLEDLSSLPADTTKLTIGPKTRSVELVSKFPKLTHLWTWAPPPELMEQIASIPSLEFLVVSGVQKLPAKFKLPRLHRLALINLGKLKSLEGLQSLSSLKNLRVTNAKLLLDYSPIGALRKLERLEICGEQYYDKIKSDSLDWIEALTELRDVFMTFSAVNAGSGRALTGLKKLEKLFLNSKALSREEFAYLAGTMTKTECERFAGYVVLSGAKCRKCNKDYYVSMTGRGGGMLCPSCDRVKFTKLQTSFEAAVKAACK